MIATNQQINYWLEQVFEEFKWDKDALERVRSFVLALEGYLHVVELPNNEGCISFIVAPDLKGGYGCDEILMYIKPEARGNPRNLLKLVDLMENEAKALDLHTVKIASNIGYKDDRVISILMRRGYSIDTVRKEI